MLNFAPVKLGQIPLRRHSLGAEELIELGRATFQQPFLRNGRRALAQGTSLPSPQTVTITAQEGRLLLKVAQNIVQFSQDYQIEFQSYCPAEVWKQALADTGTWTHEIDRQLSNNSSMIALPADAVFRMIDLEKCVSAARDARLGTAKTAFMISAGGAIADFVFGISWLGTIAYVTGLALLLGQPLLSRFNPDPQSPYVPTMGSCRRRKNLGATCELIKMKMEEDEKNNPDARRVLERVLVYGPGLERHYWGDVMTPDVVDGEYDQVCLTKGRFRVRVEGKPGMQVVPTNGWTVAEAGECWGSINIAVYDTAMSAEGLAEADLNQDSGHEKSYWVEYWGPSTQGRIRRAGPFGCTGDPVEQAMDDGGFSQPGVDGGYRIYGPDGLVESEF